MRPTLEGSATPHATGIDGKSRDAVHGWSLQQSQLPERLPQLPGIALAARYVTASNGSGAGGDWYDAIPLPGGRVALVMGDVVGRGHEAATSMAALRNALRAYALEDEPPSLTIAKLEHFAAALEPGCMTTLVYAVLDRAAGSVRFVSAGHPPPLLVPLDGEPAFAPHEGSAPVGAGPDPRRAAGEIFTPARTTLLLYSNSLVGRRGERPVVAREHLREAVARGRREPEPLVAGLVGALLDGPPLTDDVAVLAVQVAPSADADLHLTVPAAPEELAEVRWALRRWLAGHGASDQEVASITLACQEACANAVEHAYGLPDATFELTARQSNGVIEILVRDRGKWRPPRGEHRGRGLTIMRSLIDEVDVIAAAAGTAVRLAHRLEAAA